jgi:dTDP-4-dehydrorhamnose reductase
MRVLVLGATGLLGSAVFHVLSEKIDWHVFGTLRTEESKRLFEPRLHRNLVVGVDVLDQVDLIKTFEQSKPDVVINCVSLAKPLLSAGCPLDIIPIYAMLPHRLAHLCSLAGARLVHISTDGVFSGSKGQYIEDDIPDARDLYGLSKLMGEIIVPHAIMLRTSMLGPELQGANGLLAWFLSQQETCKCFGRAIFSGLPTVVLAQIIRDYVIPEPELFGVYHVAAQPISKFDLLKLVAEIYGKTIELIRVDQPVCDRSLNPAHFREATGYVAPAWSELIRIMHDYKTLGWINNVQR